jgi:hypothetical protein
MHSFIGPPRIELPYLNQNPFSIPLFTLPLVLTLNSVKWRVERPFYPYHEINSLHLFECEHSFSTFIVAQKKHKMSVQYF